MMNSTNDHFYLVHEKSKFVLNKNIQSLVSFQDGTNTLGG